MGRFATRRWSAAGIAGLLVAAVVPPSAAEAHGGLVATTPAQGATVAAPVEAVSLTFTEKPAPSATFTVTAPTGARVDGGWSHAAPVPLNKPVREYQLTNGVWEPLLYSTGFPVSVTVSHWPAPGTYVLRYQSVASDGDQVKGEVSFTYRGAVTAAPAGWQAPADPPVAPPQAAVDEPVRDTSRWLWLVPVLLAVAAVLGYLIVRPPPFVTARRRP